MTRAKEHHWYGDVARDMGFSPLQPEENVPANVRRRTMQSA
jgi:hypothetical protein